MPGWARVLESFTRFAAPAPGARTLDVGCGPGALVRRWAALGCWAFGVDLDPAMLVQARRLALEAGRGDVAGCFFAAPAGALPFETGAFDFVTASNLIFLVPEPAAALAELARVCRPGGQVAMLNPSPRLSSVSAQAHAQTQGLTGLAAESLVIWAGLAEQHRRFSAPELHALLGAAGLVPEAIVEKVGPGLALFARARKG